MFAKLGAVAFAARAKTKRDILEDRKKKIYLFITFYKI